MNNKKTFSVIVPVYQNAANLGDTIPKLLSLQAKLPEYHLEFIFVDDGSTDGSYEKLVEHYQLYRDKLKIIKFTKNFGQNSAIFAGLHAANGDCAGIISADLQDPYELFVDMIEKWENGTKLVIGKREDRKETAIRCFISNLYWRMVDKFAVEGFPPGGFDFCLIDRQIISHINKMNEKNTHVFVLMFSLGYDYEIIPYTREQRTAGKSQWTLSKKIKLFTDTFVSFSYTPIRGISYMGMTISVLSFLYAILVAISKYYFKNDIEGWTTIVVLVSIFGGLILLTLGIIGEYIWRMMQEIRKRPNYITEEVLENKWDVSK